MRECIEPIVGKILAGWRYDISGLAPEMREDYEQHFAECERCSSRQKLHRVIDISLIVLASASAAVFLLAFAAIRYFEPRHAFWLELGALAGFCAIGADLADCCRRNARAHRGGRCGETRRAPCA